MKARGIGNQYNPKNKEANSQAEKKKTQMKTQMD